MNAPKDCLSYFGITQSCKDQQKPAWTIEIDCDDPESKRRFAYFDDETGKWRLGESANNDHDMSCRSTGEAASYVLESTSQPQDNSWTTTLLSSDHTDFFRNFDWTKTPLGPLDTWPHSLRLHTHMLFSDSRPAAIYWGPQFIDIYNEKIVPLIGESHPNLMGNSLEEVMLSCWSFLGPQFRRIQEGDSVGAWEESDMTLTRDGYLEETWWNGGLVSLKDDQGIHAGVYFSWVESTDLALRDRRTALISRLGQWPFASSSEAWHHVHEVFSNYPRDIPMAVMYGINTEDPEGPLCLKYTIGTTPDHSAAPRSLNVSNVISNPLFLVGIINVKH